MSCAPLAGSEQQCLDTPLVPLTKGAAAPGSAVGTPGALMELPSHSVQGRGSSSPGEQLPNSLQASLELLFTNKPEPGPRKSPIKFTTAPLSAASCRIPRALALLGVPPRPEAPGAVCDSV